VCILHLGSTWPSSSPFVLLIEEKGRILVSDTTACNLPSLYGATLGTSCKVKTEYSSDINLDWVRVCTKT